MRKIPEERDIEEFVNKPDWMHEGLTLGGATADIGIPRIEEINKQVLDKILGIKRGGNP